MYKRQIKYPSHVHSFSPYLTLQGAVAHCDMPIESGPTKLLPFSQTLPEGYLVFDQPEFQVYFEDNYIQLPLEKNDLIFFNPAIMHAAGQNISSDIYRMANLCLLYTSDAADEEDSVDLGGRRIIKKNKIIFF